jgi:hypothetical protein
MTPRHTPNRLTLDAILPHLRTKRVASATAKGMCWRTALRMTTARRA